MCFFLSCKANARVKLAKTGHGPHSSTLVVICVVQLLFVSFYALFVCKSVLPPGDNPIAVNKCIISCRVNNSFPTRNQTNNLLAFLLTTKRLVAKPKNPRQPTPKAVIGNDTKPVSFNFQTLNFPSRPSKPMSSNVFPTKTSSTLSLPSYHHTHPRVTSCTP